MATITDCRLTFIWVETVLDALTGTLAPGLAAMPQAVSRPSYVKWFDATQATRPGPGEPTPPWPPHGRQRVWARYLRNDALEKVSGAAAWKQVVPLRIQTPIDVGHEQPDAAIRTEGLVHPWAVVFIATVTRTREWTDFGELTASLVDHRRAKHYRHGTELVTIDTVGARGLHALRARVFGPGIGQRRPEPFTIFTAIRGTGTDMELNPALNESLHRAIQTAASFSKTWDRNDLVTLDERRVAGGGERPAMHIVYGTRRGRAIWGPAGFARTDSHPLSCQHRNLTIVSALVESLTALAQETIAQVGGSPIGGDHEFLARRAMQMLGPLYLGSDNTHRTGSVRAQIDANGWLDDINALRKRLALTALTS